MILLIALLISVGYALFGMKKPAMALATLPVTCIVFVVWVLALDEPGLAFQAFLCVPMIALSALGGILLPRADTEVERWPQTWAKWILRLLALALVLVTGITLLNLNPRAVYLVLPGFLGVLVFIVALIAYGTSSKKMTASHVFGTIGASMRQNLPLPMALESAVSGRYDNPSRILRNIRRWLVQGHTLSEALRYGYPKCPRRALGMIEAGERIGQVPAAIQALETDMIQKAEQDRKIEPVNLVYPVLLIAVTGFLILQIMTFIVPQFINILSDFMEVEKIPWATRTLMAIAHIVFDNQPWFMLFVFFLVLWMGPIRLCLRRRVRRLGPACLWGRITDRIKWHLPVFHWFEKNRSVLQTVEMLRLSLITDSTVDQAIDNTLGLDTNNCFRKKLSRWLVKVRRGENISSAARICRLGDPLAWAFDDKLNTGQTPEILEMLESFYRSNYNYRVHLFRFITQPLVTLVVALMVGFVIFSFFSLPVAVIQEMLEHIYP